MKGGNKSEEIINYVFYFENVYFYIIIGSEQNSSNINVSKLEVLYSEMKRELKLYARNNFANLQSIQSNNTGAKTGGVLQK